MKKIINVDFNHKLLKHITIDDVQYKIMVKYREGNYIGYEIISIDKTPVFIYSQINQSHLQKIEYECSSPITLDDVIDTYAYGFCSMICNIEQYTLYVECECKIRIINNQFVETDLEYFDINIKWMEQLYSNYRDWSEHIQNPSIARLVLQRIDQGFYNYELAYKTFDLIG
jgi:hypothetical protein